MSANRQISISELRHMIMESMMDEARIEDILPGMGQRFSKRPAEPVRMPVKSAAEAFKLAVDGEEEFMGILRELTKDLKDVDISRGRIKATGSLERKCRDFGLEVADLDDVSGKAIIVKSIEDEEAVGQMLKDDPRTFRIFDYLDDPADSYYGIHANYRLSNGLVAEIQVRTIKLYTFMVTYGHILYETWREFMPKAKQKGGKYMEVFQKYDEIFKQACRNCRRADETGEKIPKPEIDLTDEELAVIEECVSPATYMRFELILNGKAKELAYQKNFGKEAEQFLAEKRRKATFNRGRVR